MSRPYPPVEYYAEGFYRLMMEPDDTPTHMVVPLSAMVIERDDNGQWPDELWLAVQDFLLRRGVNWSGLQVLELLDALAAARREEQT